MKRLDLEHIEQCKVIQWFNIKIARQEYPEDWDILFAIPNGGKRDKKTAGKIKNEGGKAGIPDLNLPVANSKYIGLWVEMKKPVGGVTSKVQKEVHAKLRRIGHRVEVCNTAVLAISVIEEYLRDA